MLKLAVTATVAAWAAGALAHGGHDGQKPIAGPHKSLWYNTLPGDGGTQAGFPPPSGSAVNVDVSTADGP